MNRRNLIKVLGVTAVGAATVPLWLDAWTSLDLPSETLELSKDQKLILSELVDTIIPAGNIPGAKELEVDKFVRVMVAGCFEEGIQKAFLEGFDELETYSKEKYGKAFVELSDEKQVEYLNVMESTEADPEKKIHFVSFVKELTITGYLSSQYILENHLGYEFIPGRFDGSFPVENSVYSNA